MGKINQKDKKMGTHGNSKTIFVVEIRMNGAEWKTTPKIFYIIEEAEKECELLIRKYTFIDECRVVARREKE